MPRGFVNWFLTIAAFCLLLLMTFGALAQPMRGGLVTSTTFVAHYAKQAPSKAAVSLKRTYAQNVTEDLRYSASLLYIRERTGNNDAPEIDAWARATGTALHSSWCGLFQWAIQTHRKGPIPNGPAGSYNWFKDPRRTFYVRDQRGSLDSLKPADKVGLFYANLGRIGHILLVVSKTRGTRKGRPARGYVLRSGNTGRGGGRDGAGVWDRFYTASDIFAAARW